MMTGEFIFFGQFLQAYQLSFQSWALLYYWPEDYWAHIYICVQVALQVSIFLLIPPTTRAG